jgi:hypothetical protein
MSEERPRRGHVAAGGTSVSARFDGTENANRATRALQKELGLAPGDVSAVLAPGTIPNLGGGREGYMGLTKVGAILVHARARTPEMVERVRALLQKLGGELVLDEVGTVSTGGYGPTTAHGARSVFGGPATTSSMANQRFTYEKPKEPPETPPKAD